MEQLCPCSCLCLFCNTNPVYIHGSGLHIQAVCIKPSTLPKPLGLVTHTWKRFICIVMWIMSPKWLQKSVPDSYFSNNQKTWRQETEQEHQCVKLWAKAKSRSWLCFFHLPGNLLMTNIKRLKTSHSDCLFFFLNKWSAFIITNTV